MRKRRRDAAANPNTPLESSSREPGSGVALMEIWLTAKSVQTKVHELMPITTEVMFGTVRSLMPR